METDLQLDHARNSELLAASERFGNLSSEKRALLVQRLVARRAAASVGTAISRREVKSPCALSFGQELMWILDQLTPGNNAYNAPGVRHAKGMLNLPALQRAVETIVERHEILRTRYAHEDGIPVQVIDERCRVELPVVDLRAIPEPQRSEEAHRLMVVEAQRPFDLARDLMVRVMLVRLADDEHLMLFAMHHIATDGWSKEVMYRELATLYGAFQSGQPSQLCELPIQYADFALWQRRWLAGERLAKLLSFWRRTLEGAAPVLVLPTDRPRPAVQSVRGAHKRFAIPRGATVGLKALSQREGSTLYMVLLSAFKTLLHRYTAQTDILVGSPVAARNMSELEGLIGYFSNTLVMRTDLAGDPSFREVLRRVRETTLAAYEHQEMPFEKLVVELRPERDFSHTPLVQVAFILHGRALGQSLEVPGLVLSAVEIERGTAKFDLTLSMIDIDGDLFGSCEYNTDLFDEATIVRMQDHFRAMLEAIVADPDQPISALQLLPAQERQQVLVDWNDTGREVPRGSSIPRLFEAQAERLPDQAAVIAGNRSLSYSALNRRANQLARLLRRRGVGPDVPVGICSNRAPELAVAILAVLKAGGACVPLDPDYPPDRLAGMVSDCGAPVLLTTKHLLALLPESRASVLCLDTDAAEFAGELDTNLGTELAFEQAAYIIYTSGSTGQPKGVVLTHGGLVNHALAAIELYGISPSDRVLQFASLSFDISLEELLPTWCAGATVVFRPDDGTYANPSFGEWLSRQRITVVDLPTAFWQEWVHDLAARNHVAPDTLRLVIVGGEKATATARAIWLERGGRDIRWVNTYGPTEGSIIATAYEPPRDTELLSDEADPPIGRPIANTQIYILDAHRQPVPIGVPGELYIGGMGLARGYLHSQAGTAERFVDHPFSSDTSARLYRTGDRARWRRDGLIEFLGRLDDQVKIRGYRIEPGEIEAVLLQQPSVKQAAVVLCDDATAIKRLVAYVSVDAMPGPSSAELREQLSRKLPEYMIPAEFVTLPALPLNPNGKVDRHALPAPDLSRLELESTFAPPQSPAEERLARIWCEILGLERVGIHDDFFELGGHSLLFLRLWARIKEAFGQEHPVNVVFRHRTIEQLANFLEPAQAAGTRVFDATESIESERPRLICLDHIAIIVNNADGVPIHPLGFAAADEKPIWGIDSVEKLAEAYIAQLKESSPEGPYRLCGYCGSASIAFEMARQLEEGGDEVPMVILVEPKRVGPPRTAGRRWAVRFRWGVIRFGHHALRLASTPLEEWPGYGRWLVSRFFRRTPLLNKLDTSALEGEWWRERNWLKKAYASYQPRPYRGRVTILMASQRFRIGRDLTVGWDTVALGGVETHIVPGEHGTIIRGKDVRNLAEKIREVYLSSLASKENGRASGSPSAESPSRSRRLEDSGVNHHAPHRNGLTKTLASATVSGATELLARPECCGITTAS